MRSISWQRKEPMKITRDLAFGLTIMVTKYYGCGGGNEKPYQTVKKGKYLSVLAEGYFESLTSTTGCFGVAIQKHCRQDKVYGYSDNQISPRVGCNGLSLITS
jgi:hypothetical protein